MVPTLQTERLILRSLELADAEQVQQLFPHWEVVKHLNSIVPWPYPADGSLTHIRDATLPAMERGDEWGWSIRLKSQPEQLIGRISLYKGENNNRGFWLGVPWHGKGYMTEACDAATDFWFETLGFEVLRVPKAIDNTASRKISLHQGMRVIREEVRDYVSGKLPSEVWELTRDDWRKSKARMTVKA
jgi:[ribosomal protein S5]-alanine N-acetyltransferase